MTLNQNPQSTKRFAVIGYTGSKRSRAICCFLTRNEIITEREKSKYFDNISVLPTSIFIFDKFVDGAQPEVAGKIIVRRHILRTRVLMTGCDTITKTFYTNC
jgi:hypothetical protein